MTEKFTFVCFVDNHTKLMISFNLVLSLYAIIGIVIILDDKIARKKDSPNWYSRPNSAYVYQAVSACGRWMYALRPSEKAVVVIERKTGSLVKLLELPFVPQSIRLNPTANQMSIMAVGGVEAGELRVQVSDLS